MPCCRDREETKLEKSFNMTLDPVPRDFRVVLEESVRDYGDREAYIVKTKRESGGQSAEYRRVTFREFCREARILGTALLDLFPAGAHIGVMGENRYEWCLSYLSIITAGDVVVPVDKELNKDEIHHVLSESGSWIIEIIFIREIKKDSSILILSFAIVSKISSALEYDGLFS